MNDDHIVRLIILASQLIICPPTFIATGMILGTRFTLLYWFAMGVTTALSCLTADKVYTSRTNPFAWLLHGIAALIVEVRFTRHIRPLLERQEEPVYSDDFHHMDEALRIMATAGKISIAPQHQEIEPYIPPEPLPRYEIVMHDDWQSGSTSDMPLQVNEKAVTSFSSEKTVDRISD